MGGNLLCSDLGVNSHVFIHGLTSAAGAKLNLRAGRIVKEEDEGRWGVQVIGGATPSKPVLLKRMNLLNASFRQDREIFLGLLTLHHAPELRVVRTALNNWLNEDIGLLLLVASYVTHRRQCLFQFGGYMGRIWEENWCYADPARPLAVTQKPARRLDAACAELGLGRVLFAGGCGDHPRKCSFPYGFFKTAEVYDSLVDEWAATSDMPTRRHGSTACRLGPHVYVLGGTYVDETSAPPTTKFCDVFHIDSATWASLPDSDYEHVRSVDLGEAAFFGACAVDGRIVALLKGVAIAYNPATTEDGALSRHPCQLRLVSPRVLLSTKESWLSHLADLTSMRSVLLPLDFPHRRWMPNGGLALGVNYPALRKHELVGALLLYMAGFTSQEVWTRRQGPFLMMQSGLTKTSGFQFRGFECRGLCTHMRHLPCRTYTGLLQLPNAVRNHRWKAVSKIDAPLRDRTRFTSVYCP